MVSLFFGNNLNLYCLRVIMSHLATFNSSDRDVLDLVSQVRDVVLMNVYLDLGTPGGRDFGIGGI
jgi:hypothetical protein